MTRQKTINAGTLRSSTSSPGATITAPELNPKDISGLVGWFDFSDVSTLFTDTGRTTPVSADGQTIKGMTDKSGAGYHLSQATNAPTYKVGIKAGRSVGLFDGLNDTLVSTDAPDFAAVTVVLVGYCDPAIGTYAGPLHSRVAGKKGWNCINAGIANVYRPRYCTWDGAAEVAGTGIPSDPGLTGKWSRVTHTDPDTLVQGNALYINDVSVSVNNVGAGFTGTTGGYVVGRGYGSTDDPSRNWKGYIGEILIWNRVLTATELAYVWNRLSDRWGAMV